MSSVSKMRDCLLLVCNNNVSPVCICSWDRAEIMCPQSASLWGSTAAVANTEVILVASHSLFKESSSSSAWGGERKCSAGESRQHPTTPPPQTLAQCTAEWCHVKGNSTVQPCLLKCYSFKIKIQQGSFTRYIIFHLLSYICLRSKCKIINYITCLLRITVYLRHPEALAIQQYQTADSTNRWKASHKTFNFMDFKIKQVDSLKYSYSSLVCCPQL